MFEVDKMAWLALGPAVIPSVTVGARLQLRRSGALLSNSTRFISKFPKTGVRKALHASRLDITHSESDVLPYKRHAAEADFAKVVEKHLLSLELGRLLRDLEVNCVLDVGANEGQYGRSLRNLGYTGHIISFEPVRTSYVKLAAAAKGDSQWEVYNWALGSKDGTSSIHVSSDDDVSSILNTDPQGKQQISESAATESVEQIDVRRLDSVINIVTGHISNPRIFLKMDTRGSDLEVFAGAIESRKKFVGLQSEVSVTPIYENMPSMQDALAAYRANGFEIAGFFPVTMDAAKSTVIEFDCLMARA